MKPPAPHRGRCLDHLNPFTVESTLSPGSPDNPKRQAHGIIIWMLQVELETEVWDFYPSFGRESEDRFRRTAGLLEVIIPPELD
jgi:hypothetical protein